MRSNFFASLQVFSKYNGLVCGQPVVIQKLAMWCIYRYAGFSVEYVRRHIFWLLFWNSRIFAFLVRGFSRKPRVGLWPSSALSKVGDSNTEILWKTTFEPFKYSIFYLRLFFKLVVNEDMGWIAVIQRINSMLASRVAFE